jgi:CDP-paratose 2-epimerase
MAKGLLTIGDADPVLITGGAGFIGTNLADRLASEGRSVIIYDNLSRDGVDQNLRWLCDRHGRLIEPRIADVRDAAALQDAVSQVRHVVHLAAQVAVTTSLLDPFEDFEINARGTLNVLGAIRAAPEPPSLLFTSTNKVYGGLEDLALEAREDGYAPVDERLRDAGISEKRPLDLSSPYGCSKGCADQYVLDHARVYGLRTAVFRMSCIYGPHQCGTEDQGWVAHFFLRALARRPITIYGDGLQVRDALYVEDLVDAMCAAEQCLAQSPAEIAGQAFNIGGGPRNATSVLGLLRRVAFCTGEAIEPVFGPWRPGDQRYYVTDIGKFSRLTGWRPAVGLNTGMHRIHRAMAGLGSTTMAVAQAGALAEEAGAR